VARNAKLKYSTFFMEASWNRVLDYGIASRMMS
jgi:hypothetical protein